MVIVCMGINRKRAHSVHKLCCLLVLFFHLFSITLHSGGNCLLSDQNSGISGINIVKLFDPVWVFVFGLDFPCVNFSNCSVFFWLLIYLKLILYQCCFKPIDLHAPCLSLMIHGLVRDSTRGPNN